MTLVYSERSIYRELDAALATYKHDCNLFRRYFPKSKCIKELLVIYYRFKNDYLNTADILVHLIQVTDLALAQKLLRPEKNLMLAVCHIIYGQLKLNNAILKKLILAKLLTKDNVNSLLGFKRTELSADGIYRLSNNPYAPNLTMHHSFEARKGTDRMLLGLDQTLVTQQNLNLILSESYRLYKHFEAFPLLFDHVHSQETLNSILKMNPVGVVATTSAQPTLATNKSDIDANVKRCQFFYKPVASAPIRVSQVLAMNDHRADLK